MPLTIYDKDKVDALLSTKIDEAPIDGTTYARKDAAWVNVATASTVNNIDLSTSDYYLVLGDANNVVNVSAGDGSLSGKYIYITAESSVNFPIGTQILFTVSVSGSSNYIYADTGVTILQASNSLNTGFMRKAVKLGSDLWMISSQI